MKAPLKVLVIFALLLSSCNEPDWYCQTSDRGAIMFSGTSPRGSIYNKEMAPPFSSGDLVEDMRKCLKMLPELRYLHGQDGGRR